jgi:copper ion binding protein
MTDHFLVPGVSCDHCVRAISQEVGALEGVQQVVVDLSTKNVRIDHNESVSTEVLIKAINEAGFDEVSVLA